MPTSFQVRASLVEVPLLSTSTNDRSGFRVERLPPPSPLSLSPTPLLRHGVGRSGFTCTRKLSLTAPLLSAVNPKPPLAFPSRRCRDAALTSSISHGCHTNRHIPPIHRGRSRQHSKPTAVFYYPSATLTPPQARWAVRRLTASLRQCRRPLHSLRVTYGLGQGQVGLLSAVQAPQQKACRSAALHDTCHLL